MAPLADESKKTCLFRVNYLFPVGVDSHPKHVVPVIVPETKAQDVGAFFRLGSLRHPPTDLPLGEEIMDSYHKTSQ